MKKGWAVVAVVALQAVAQTTAMALLSVEESESSRSLSAEDSLNTRTAGKMLEEKNVFIEEKMENGADGSRCHMGKDGKDCFVEREADPPFSKMLNKAQMAAMVELLNEKLSLASNRRKREPEDFSEKESLAMARINGIIEGGHQPPTEKSRIARDIGESAVNSFVTGEDESSALSKSLPGLESASTAERCSEGQPSAETRGLLSGLLGGGGSGGNCTAQGASVSKHLYC